MRHYNIPIFIPHLGCPYDCIYCDQRTIAAQTEAPDSRQILQIIDRHLATINPPAEIEAAFFGGSFTAISPDLQEEYLGLVQPYLEQNLIQGIRLSTRPDCIDAAVLERLRRYGVTTVELGVQSLDDEVLRKSGRIYSAATVEKSCALIKAGGFKLGVQLMVGLPGDDYRQDLETARRTVAIGPQMVRIYPTLVLAGTPLERMWEEGRYQALTLEEAVPVCRDMLLQFDQAGIPVIRLGLYPGEELRREGVVKAGPFHPSFGELVEQAIFKQQALLAIELCRRDFTPGDDLTLAVNERDLSKLLGKNRGNLADIQRGAELRELNVIPRQDEARNWISVRDGADENGREFILTRTEFLQTIQ